MTEMKYVVMDSDECGEQLFVFPKTIDHDRFAEVLSLIKHGVERNWNRIYRKPVSAGFTDGTLCYGKSETLGLRSRDKDTALLRNGGKP